MAKLSIIDNDNFRYINTTIFNSKHQFSSPDILEICSSNAYVQSFQGSTAHPTDHMAGK
jgi:hypothetical protein